MIKTLVIVPTKDRAEYINAFVQNLIKQPGVFDLFIADMSTDSDYLKDNWFINKGLERLQHCGHNYVVHKTSGYNQLFGYQVGLHYAVRYGYDCAVASDDDCIFDIGWLETLLPNLQREDVSVAAGITLLPWMSDEDQRCPEWFVEHKDHAGTLDQVDYYHATLIPPWTEAREYEHIYGPFLFKTSDFWEVGGFPQFLSPLGFRGEMWPMEACHFRGKKLLVDPKAKCYHYSASHGGLKMVGGEDRGRFLESDKAMWDEFVRRRMTRVEVP